MSLLDRYLTLKTEVSAEEYEAGELPVPEVDVPPVRDVTDEEAEEAEELLEDLHESEVLSDDTDAMVDDLEDVVESLENFHKVFSHGHESQQYSAQFAAYAATSLKPFAEYFPHVDTPAFEDFSQDTLGEYYERMVAALEDHVSETTQRQADGVTQSVVKLVNSLFDGVTKKRLQAIVDKADLALRDLNDIPAGEVEVKLNVFQRHNLSMGGEVPNSLVEGAKRERATHNFVFGKYWKDAVAYHKAIFETIKESQSAKSGDEVKRLTHKKVPSKTPESNLPDSLVKGTGLFGNVYWTFDGKSRTSSTVDDAFAIIQAVSPKRHDLDHRGRDKTIKTNKAELVKLVQEVKANAKFLLDQLERIKSDLNMVVANSSPVVQQGGKWGWFFLSAIQRGRLLRWAAIYARVFVPFINQILRDGIRSNRDLLKFSRKAMKELKKANKD